MTGRERNFLARQAAIAWVLMGVVTSSAWGVVSVPRLFVVRDDPAATARRILQAETLYRTAIAGELVSQTAFLFLGLTLYRLLRDVQRDWARAMVVLVAAGAAVGVASCLTLAAPLVLLRGPTSADLTPAQLEQLSYASLRLRGVGTTLLTWFLGLWLIPLGLLVARSRFLPRMLGPLVICGGVAHALYAVVVLTSPEAGPAFFRYVAQPSGVFGEAPLLLWLLIKGADHTRPGDVVRAAGEPVPASPPGG